MIPTWRCRDCLETCDNPSFSEGPKTKDPETGVESVRFRESRLVCPTCFSPRLDPPDGVARRLAT